MGFTKEQIGARLREARLGLGLALRDAARLVPGMTGPNLRWYEVGRSDMTGSVLAGFSQAYGVPVGWFLGLEELPPETVQAAVVRQAARQGAVEGAASVLREYAGLNEFMGVLLRRPEFTSLLDELVEGRDTFNGDAGSPGSSH